MPTARTSYHHGALRETLLDVCLRILETEGIGAVSLRRVAREAGVSPRAPYNHFPDLAALLAALSDRGFTELGERLAVARAEADSPVGALVALVRAYVDFARARPAYFRLMFRPELSESTKGAAKHTARDDAFRMVADVVASCAGDGWIAESDAAVFTITLWGFGHGIAALWTEGQLAEQADKLDRTADALIDEILALLDRLLRAGRQA